MTNARSKQVGGSHYSDHTIQPFDIADDWDLSRRLTVGLRYYLRNKGGVEKKIHDLQKCKHCIDLEIERLSSMSTEDDTIDENIITTAMHEGDW